MTASCMFPMHQGTLQQLWMVYSHVWPRSSHGCRPMNWNWTQIKLNSSLLGKNDSGANTSLCFQLSFSFSKLTLLNLLVILCGICGVFVITLIWIVLNNELLLSCPVLLIIVIHFRMVLLTLTSLGFSVYRINWPAWWQSLLHLLAVFQCFVLSIGCQ